MIVKKGVIKIAKKFQCTICGYIYDPERGDPDASIVPGTSFESLPNNWRCPQCGASKGDFEEM
ncbi:MAG: rubredoxin [Methanotrichaceae archaeon]|nr:rubredoxin [Methanotrichaceae archaeon]